MAHSSTFIDGRIEIGFGSINTVIKAGSEDLVTLCSSANVNKWAKNKPIDVGNRNIPLTDALKQSYNYGLWCDYTTGDPTDIIKQGWLYSTDHYKPSTADCCRADDFGDYKHDAVVPCWISPCSSIVAGGSAAFDVYHEEEDYTYSVKLDDLTVLSKSLLNWYPCVLISNGTTSYLVTSTQTVSEQGASMPNGGYMNVTVTLGASTFPKGEYTWYPCLCDQQITSLTTVTAIKNAGTYYFAPYPLAANDYSGTIKVTSGGGGSAGYPPQSGKTIELWVQPHCTGSPYSSSSYIDYATLAISFGEGYTNPTGTIVLNGLDFVLESGGSYTTLGSWNGSYIFEVTSGVISMASASHGTFNSAEKTIKASIDDNSGSKIYMGSGSEVFGRATAYSLTGSFAGGTVDNDTQDWLVWEN